MCKDSNDSVARQPNLSTLEEARRHPLLVIRWAVRDDDHPRVVVERHGARLDQAVPPRGGDELALDADLEVLAPGLVRPRHEAPRGLTASALRSGCGVYVLRIQSRRRATSQTC